MTDYNSNYTGAAIDAAIAKVQGIETGADVTDTANVTAAGALMDSELADIAAIKALNQGLATTDSPLFTNTEFAAIAETIAATAVDVFVYDTSKDSDGGAWRKRTQHTSWYNEPLNTATRGSRREFPAVAVIVAESNKVTIYDGDDPALPMWMVFNGVYNYAATSIPKTSVSALNGLISFGTNQGTDTTGSVVIINLLSEEVFSRRSVGSTQRGKFLGTLAQRNTNAGWDISTDQSIVGQPINDVAMTVLPDAPIDPATGLQVPTIAVATDGGVSVIKDDGTVVDSAAATVSAVAINEDLLSYVRVDECRVIALSNVISDGFTYDRRYNNGPTYSASFLPQPLNGSNKPTFFGEKINFAASNGISSLFEDSTSQTKGMVNYTTSTYNTGWMNGDIKGAFLSDTDDTDLVGSGELVTNGTFDTDTDWTKGGSWEISGGSANKPSTGTAFIYQENALTAGQTYVLTFDLTITSGIGVDVRPSYNSGTGAIRVTTAGTNTITFVSGDGSVALASVGDFTGSIDNVSVKLADEDRSVNANGLIVNGTITRTPVATGADLVAYSGFSASNYLSQPYNADLDFGTGDFSIMGWVNTPDTGGTNTSIFMRSGATGLGAFRVRSRQGKFSFWVSDDGVSTIDEVIGTTDIDNSTWQFVCAVRSGSNILAYVNGSLEATTALSNATGSLSSADAVSRVGLSTGGTEAWDGSLALLRISATAPTAEQIKKIYNDEKVLFQENAQATLYGSSDAVTALAHDPVTDLLHVGTSAGRSVFQGLRRVSNTTTAVGTTISASNGLVVEE